MLPALEVMACCTPTRLTSRQNNFEKVLSVALGQGPFTEQYFALRFYRMGFRVDFWGV